MAAPAAAEAAELAARVAALDPGEFDQEAVRQLMTAAVLAYGRHLDAGVGFAPISAGVEVTATDAVRAASALLKATNLEPFELALWQTWGGMPWFETERIGRGERR